MMITSVLCVLFALAAVSAMMVLVGSAREALRLHSGLRQALAACGDIREVSVRYVDVNVGPAIGRLRLMHRAENLASRIPSRANLPLAA